MGKSRHHGVTVSGGDFLQDMPCGECEDDETRVPFDWAPVARSLGVPYGWRLWARRHRDGWKLLAAGADPMHCGHSSMQVTADNLPLAVARMSQRLDFHRNEADGDW